MIIMRIIRVKLNTKKNAVIQWYTQVGNITTNLKVKIYFTLPEPSATKIVAWSCHVDDSTKGAYGIILGRDLLTALVLNLKLSEHVIEADGGTLKGSSSPLVDLVMYKFRNLSIGKVTP